VGDQYHSIGVVGQKGFQPLDGFDIQVVGRLIKQQHIRALQQQLGQFDAHAPTSAEFVGGSIEVCPCKAQPGQRFLHLGLVVVHPGQRQSFILMG